LLFFLYLGRRAWRVDQEYRRLAAGTHRAPLQSTHRTWLGSVAWCAAIYYALVLVGYSGYEIYLTASTLASLPKSYAVINSPTGVLISGNPQEWNNHAWRLATASDPGQRDPAEAVRLAEQAISAEPKNDNFFNTLGVARYRAGDFKGAIDALTHGMKGGERKSHDAFFLAMAYARLGDHAQAGTWYANANRWMRENDPKDAELRRFREEASAVLDVADDRVRNSPEPKKDESAGAGWQ
jgi:hypothetical protein